MISQAQNPFFQEFSSTPHSTTPFNEITVADYEPAVDRGIKLGLQDVDAIVKQRSVPDFENTIVALKMLDFSEIIATFATSKR